MMLMSPYRRKAFLTGIRSGLDLQGTATYTQMQKLMPPPANPQPAGLMFLRASMKMSNTWCLYK